MTILSTAAPLPSAPTPSSEDSSLFSLDVLEARARAAVPRSASDHDAASSGVIDLDALRDGEAADSTTTPGGGALLSAAARLTTTAQPVLPPPSGAPRWAVATLGLLAGAVAMLGAVALGTPEPTSAVRDPVAGPTMAVATVDPPTTEGDAELDPSNEAPDAKPETRSVDPPAPSPPEGSAATAEPKAQPRARTRSRTKRSTKRSPKSSPKRSTKATPSKPSTPTPTPPPTTDQGNLSVDCILDPSSCGRGTKAKKSPAKPTAPRTSLPSKLSNTALRSALAGPKAQAKQCRDIHAGAAGTTVRVKLSIAGSGTVRSATPQAPHDTALGRCVADALRKAEFEPFAKSAMGVVYSVRL